MRGTCGPHVVNGWYTARPAELYYRYYRVWIQETRAEHKWFPAKVAMPSASSIDAAASIARDLIKALQHLTFASPIYPIDSSQHATLQHLATIFASATNGDPVPIPTIPTPPPPNPPVLLAFQSLLPAVSFTPSAPSPSPLPRVLPPTEAPTAPAQFPRVPQTKPTYASTTSNPRKVGAKPSEAPVLPQ